MRKYEAMFIVKPDLTEEGKKVLFGHINDAVTKSNGVVTQSAVWAERRKLFFPLNKLQEGIFYLLNFDVDPSEIVKIRHVYKLNEDILRVLITVR